MNVNTSKENMEENETHISNDSSLLLQINNSDPAIATCDEMAASRAISLVFTLTTTFIMVCLIIALIYEYSAYKKKFVSGFEGNRMFII